MKKLLALFTIAALVSFQAFGQEKEQNVEKLEQLESETMAESADTLVQDTYSEDFEIDIVDDTIGDISEDETSFKIGDKKVTITDDEEDFELDLDEDNDDNEEWVNVGGRRNFKGHLGGFEFGFNSYGNEKFGTTIDNNSWDLNTAKSSSFNMIMPSINLGFGKHIGIVTAIGFNFSNYRFDNNVIVEKDATGITVARTETLRDYEKSKLATIYATLPIILEAQIPLSDGNPINLGVGVVGAIKLGSHTKVVYNEDGRQKDKNHNDFNLNLLRYGVTARVGYKMFQIYGTSYLTPLFETGKGPEMYPFEIGIALTFND